MERVSQSPTDLGFVQDPYPFYAAARHYGDLVYWTDYKMPCAVSHRAVAALLKDRRFGREEPEERRKPIPEHLRAFYAVEAHSMLELEPPHHTRLRALVLRAFTSRRIKELAPEISTLCHQLVDQFPDDGPFDLLTHYAQHLPVIIIARLLGVPEDMAPDLLRWSNAMVGMYQAGRSRVDEDSAITATEEFVAFLRRYVQDRRADPRDDLISHLIAAEDDGQKLSTDELITTCILLLNAGHEATVHTLGNGVKALLETGHRPGSDPAPMIEEILRYDPPLHMFTRYAYERVEVFGHIFERGDEVGLMLASAGRDHSIYDAPDEFRANRTGPANLAFGGGLHFCVGAPLARLELQIALPILFDRCPTLTLTQTPQYADIFHFHGLSALMVNKTEKL